MQLEIDDERLKRIKESTAESVAEALEIDNEKLQEKLREIVHIGDDRVSRIIVMVTEDDDLDYFEKMALIYGLSHMRGTAESLDISKMLGAMFGGGSGFKIQVSGGPFGKGMPLNFGMDDDSHDVVIDDTENTSWMDKQVCPKCGPVTVTEDFKCPDCGYDFDYEDAFTR